MESEKTSILILDDEPIVGKRLQPSLERKGYEVEVFTAGSEAMARLAQRRFDIVITDLVMEGMDGMQVLTAVKEQYPETEVIVITGYATMEKVRETFNRGGFDFLAKPFKLGEIVEVIASAVAAQKSGCPHKFQGLMSADTD